MFSSTMPDPEHDEHRGKAAPNLSILSYRKAGNGFPSCLFKYVLGVYGHKGAIVNDLGN